MKPAILDRGAGPVLLVLFVGAVVAVVVAATLLGTFTAIKGAYIAVAAAIATGLYYRTRFESTAEVGLTTPSQESIRRLGPRLVGLAAVWAVGIAVVTGDRALGLLVCLPVGFGLLALQVIAGVGSRTVVVETVALYGASSVGKYLANGFYFGGGDTLYHVRNVATLVRTGSVAGVPRYKFFPGFPVLTGAIRMLGGISAYDAIVITGIITYGAVVCCAFVLVRTATGNERLGAFAAVGLVMAEPFLYYATYFFPQSLAVALAIFVLYVAYRANQNREARFRFSLVGLGLAAALVLTHQLTVVLFVPIVAVLFSVTYLLTKADGSALNHSRLRLPRGYLAGIVGFASLSYWAYRSDFLAELASSVVAVARLSLFTSSSGAPTPTYVLGAELPALTNTTALRSLLSTDGIYQTMLLVVFLLGVVTVIDRLRTHWSALPLFSVGVVGAVVMFRTPLTIPGLDRLQLPLTVFFAVVVGIGLYRLSRSGDRTRAALVACVVLVAAVGATAPLNYNAGDDLYALNAGPNLYELYPTPQPQRAYSDAEYHDLEAVSGFVERHNATLFTLGADGQAMVGLGVNSRAVTVNRSGIGTGDGLFLYRHEFAHHRLSYSIPGSGVALGTVVVTPRWLDATLATQSKVYASGQTGLLLSRNDSTIAPDFPKSVHKPEFGRLGRQWGRVPTNSEGWR